MANEPTLECPQCGTEIKLTKALAAPMIAATKKEFKELMDKKEEEFSEREQTLERDRKKLDDKIADRISKARDEIRIEERRSATDQANDIIKEHAQQAADAEARLLEKEEKLAEARKAQTEALRKQRELEEKERELELEVEKKIREGLEDARAQALKDAEDRMTLQIREREETIEGMKHQIEDLRRKAEQGSQQLQGEVLELQLEDMLRDSFPDDTIGPVPKGVRGADVMQSVVSSTGRPCGAILWESKRTKAWSGTWLPKLRDDQRAAKADIAVIVSQTLPKDLETFDLIDGVWVCPPALAKAIAAVLRQGLLEVSKAQLIGEGMKTKAEEVYQYLTGAQFKRRVEAIVEAFSTMQTDLDKERKAITKQWSKREAQIERVMQATTGMYGDLQGIAGSSVQEVDGLEMKALAG